MDDDPDLLDAIDYFASLDDESFRESVLQHYFGAGVDSRTRATAVYQGTRRALESEQLATRVRDVAIEYLGDLDNIGFRRALQNHYGSEANRSLALTAAFLSRELSRRSYTAINEAIKRANTEYDSIPGDHHEEREKKKRHGYFRANLGAARNVITDVYRGQLASEGKEFTPTNPRGRAARRLQAMFPVEYLQFVREEEEADRRRAEERRRESRRKRK